MNFTTASMSKMQYNPIIKIENQCHISSSQKQLQSSPNQSNRIQSNTQQTDKQPPIGNILHISNISQRLTYEQIKKGLYKLFSSHGSIYQILIKTKETGQHFAFIDYPQIKDAQKAWNSSKKQGKILDKKTLIVNYCVDPKKNVDRKDQKCYLCHEIGHKAVNCHVRPEMIKYKNIKIQQDNLLLDDIQRSPKQKNILTQQQSQQSQQSQQYSQQFQQYQLYLMKRDKDYLRFLKLKKRYLQQKLKKKMKKKHQKKY